MEEPEEVTMAQMRYLYKIYQISITKPEILSADIARKLKVSKPSVVKMLSVLRDKKLINKDPYCCVTITPNGIAKAKQFERHILLLVNHISRMGLVLPDREMYSCACAMLDALPASTLERLNLDFSVKLEVTSNTRG